MLRDCDGNPIIVANLGDDIDEIGAAWQAIEDATTRANGKIQIRIIVALDADASTAEQIAALNHFCGTVLAPLGLPYSAVIHRPPDTGDQRNVHAHILTNLRPMERVSPYNWAFSDHVRGEFDGNNGVQMLRHLWAHSMSEAAEKARRNMRYTGLGYGARGLYLETGEHLGEAKSAMVARGQPVWAWERNRIKNARNAARRAIRDADAKIAALTKVRDAAIAQMEAEQRVEPVRPIVAAQSSAPPREPLQAANLPSVRPKRIEPASSVTTAFRLRSAGSARQAPSLRTCAKPPVRERVTKRTTARNTVDQAPPRIASKPAAMPRLAMAGAVTMLSSSRPDRLRASVPLDPKPAKLVSASPPVNHRRFVAATAPTAGSIRPQRLALSIDPSNGPEPISASRAVARRASALRLSATQVIPVRDPVVVQAEEFLQSIRLDRSRRATRQAKARARWRQAKMADRAWGTRADIPTLASMPTRAWLEAHPLIAYPSANDEDTADRGRLAQLAQIDPYVADLRDGTFDIDYSALRAIGADADWLKRPAVQQGLGAHRAEQQQVVAALAAEADRRPLDFAGHGKRSWPRDLAPAQLARLDRWAVDDAFQGDMAAIERTVRSAHNARDAQRRLQEAARPAAIAVTPRKLAQPVPDGFCGMRDTPRPAYRFKDVGAHILAFDRATGRPGKSLLMLLRHCGEHPDSIAFADDGRLTGLDDMPTLIEPLLHMWRHDDRVQALVVETVSGSRQAGRAVWPPQHAAAIRALSPAGEPSRSRHSDRDLGPRL